MSEVQRRPQSRFLAILIGVLSGFVLLIGLFVTKDWRSRGLAAVLGTVGILSAVAMFVAATRSRHADNNGEAAEPSEPAR